MNTSIVQHEHKLLSIRTPFLALLLLQLSFQFQQEEHEFSLSISAISEFADQHSLVSEGTNSSGTSRLLVLDDEVWIVPWHPGVLLYMSRVERHFINEYQSTSISNEYSHESLEYFSSLNSFWIESLDWSLNGFLPSAVQIESKNVPYLKTSQTYLPICVLVNLISYYSWRFDLPP